MSKKNPFDLAEYVSLGFSCTGLIAAAVSQQVVYAAVPLMISLPIGMTNRQRLDRKIREISTQVLPAAQDAQAKNITQIEHQLKGISDRTEQQDRQIELSIYSTESIAQSQEEEITQLRDKIAEFTRLITSLQQILQPLSTQTSSINQRLDLVDLRLNNLVIPDSTQFQSVLDDVLRIDLQLDTLNRLANDSQLDLLSSQFNSHPEIQEIIDLRQQLNLLTEQINHSASQTQSFPQDLIALQLSYQDLDTSHQYLHDRTRNLDVIEQQLSTLQYQIVQLEQNPVESQSSIATLLDRSVNELNRNIQATQTNYYYELVVDRSGSHQVLIESLRQAQERIVIICPWVSSHVINDIKGDIEAALDRNVQISIGWGNLKDVGNNKNNLNHDYLLKSNKQAWKYGGISILEAMQNKYQDLLTLKVVGTHEKFLVCDDVLGMVGSHNFLTSGTSSPERELGLKTNDPYVINQLISRFHQPDIANDHHSSDLN